MADDDDLHRSLRVVADRLARAAPPLDADAVRSRPSRPARRPSGVLVAAAVGVVAVLGGAVGWRLIDDDDRQQVAAEAPTVTPFPTGPLRLMAIEVDGERVYVTEAHTTLQVDPRTGAFDGSACNDFGGEVVVEPERLDVNEVVGSQRSCAGALGDIDDALYRLLRADPRWEATPGGVDLSSADITATFLLDTGDGDEFPNGPLVVRAIEIDGEALPLDGITATVLIDAAAGHYRAGACNAHTGLAVVEGGRILLGGDGHMTQRACGGRPEAIEHALLGLLAAEPTWEATADGVVLRSTDTTATLVPMASAPTTTPAAGPPPPVVLTPPGG